MSVKKSLASKTSLTLSITRDSPGSAALNRIRQNFCRMTPAVTWLSKLGPVPEHREIKWLIRVKAESF